MIATPKATEFPPLKQIEAGVLSVGYAEVGPAGGKPSSCCTAGHTTSTDLPQEAPQAFVDAIVDVDGD